jgi:hypothetical protein
MKVKPLELLTSTNESARSPPPLTGWWPLPVVQLLPGHCRGFTILAIKNDELVAPGAEPGVVKGAKPP